jgi:hypothetical protein
MYFNRFAPDEADGEQCDVCGKMATAKVPGFGMVCGICRPEVVADLKIDDEDVVLI